MDGQDVFDTLEFQNQRVLDNKIQTVSAIEANPLVSDWQRYLPRKRQATKT